MKIIISIFLLSILTYVSTMKKDTFISDQDNHDYEYNVIKYILNYFLNFLEDFFLNLVEIRKLSNEIFREIIDTDNKTKSLILKNISNYKYKLYEIKKRFKVNYSDEKLEGIFFYNKLNNYKKIKREIKSYRCDKSDNGLTKIQKLSKNLYCLTKKIIMELTNIFGNYHKMYDTHTYNNLSMPHKNSIRETFTGLLKPAMPTPEEPEDSNKDIQPPTDKLHKVNSFLFKNLDPSIVNIIKDSKVKYLFTNLKLNYLDVVKTNKLHIKNIIKYLEEFTDTINNINFKNNFKLKIVDIFINNKTGNTHSDLKNLLYYVFDKNKEYHIFNVLNKILNNKFIKNRNKSLQGIKHLKEVKETLNNFINKRLKLVHRKLNNDDIFEEHGDYYKEMTNNFDIEAKFCKKLKLLNKPNHNSLRKSRFTNEIIDKKKKHVEFLLKKIKELNNEITDNKLREYNKYKLRTHIEAGKQIKVIEQAKDNINNANKVKLNLI